MLMQIPKKYFSILIPRKYNLLLNPKIYFSFLIIISFVALTITPTSYLFLNINMMKNDNSLNLTVDLESNINSQSNNNEIKIDGNPFDWSSNDLIAADTTGETPSTAKDLISICYREIGDSLYFRIDFKNQWTPLDAGWQSSLFTYLNEVNMRLLISFEGTNSTYKSMPGIGTEFVNLWHPWLTSVEPKTPTNQGWDYAVVLDFKRDQFQIMTPSTLSNPATISTSDYAVNEFQGMIEFRINITYAQRNKIFHTIAYTINESSTPWSPEDICPNAIGGNTNDYFDDGDIDAYASSNIRIQPAKLAIVWHANQALGKNQIEGKSIVDTYIDNKRTGFSRVIAAHVDYNAPVNLHWSGTLLTGMQWFTPDFLSVIRSAIDSGVVEIMTSTFGQSIMPWLPEDFNIYAIQKESDLIERLFGIRPNIGWVPERCWKQFIFDDLLQAGIKAVILDPQEVGHELGYTPPEDVLYATPTSEYLALNGTSRLPGGQDDPNGIPSSIKQGDLKIFIINNDVQGVFWDSCVSNNYQRFVDLKSKLAYYASINNPSKILVAGSDMEIPGGHPYGYSWDGDIGNRYEMMIKLLAGAPYVSLEKLSNNLDLDTYDYIAPGFKNAGEPDYFSSYGQPQDYWYYSRFTQESPNRTSNVFRDSDTMIPTSEYPQVPSPIHSKADIRNYSEIFYDAYNAIKNVEAITPKNKKSTLKLLELANYTLLTLTYETAWCDNYNDPQYGSGDWLASWGKNLWAHMHHAEMIAMAANWTLNPPTQVEAKSIDVDGDSYNELVIKTPLIFCVIEKEGGRITFLANINGSVLIGNPMANSQITKSYGGGGAQSPVEDYFNPITLDPQDINEYFENYDISDGLVDFFVEGAEGGYPINNGTGGYYYAVPFNISANIIGDSVDLILQSQDLPDTTGNENAQIIKHLIFEKNASFIKVNYKFKDASAAKVYIGFSPDLLSLIHYGKKYLHSFAIDNDFFNTRLFYNTYSGTLSGIGWNPAQNNSKIIDLTIPSGYSYKIPNDSQNISSSGSNINLLFNSYNINNLYINYGKDKILAREIILNIKNDSEFYLYASPNLDNLANNTTNAIYTPLNKDFSSIVTSISQLIAEKNQYLSNYTDQNPQFSEEKKIAIQNIIAFADVMKDQIEVNNFATYRLGTQSIASLNSIDWLVNPPSYCESLIQDIDGDSIDEYIIQNKYLRLAIEAKGAYISFIITNKGHILTFQRNKSEIFVPILFSNLSNSNPLSSLKQIIHLPNSTQDLNYILNSILPAMQIGIKSQGFIFDSLVFNSTNIEQDSQLPQQNLINWNAFNLIYQFPQFTLDPISSQNSKINSATFSFIASNSDTENNITPLQPFYISKSITISALYPQFKVTYNMNSSISLKTTNKFHVNPYYIPDEISDVQKALGSFIHFQSKFSYNYFAIHSNYSESTLSLIWKPNNLYLNINSSTNDISNFLTQNSSISSYLNIQNSNEFEFIYFDGDINNFIDSYSYSTSTSYNNQIWILIIALLGLASLILLIELLFKLDKFPQSIAESWRRLTKRSRKTNAILEMKQKTFNDLLQIMLDRNYPREKAIKLVYKYKNLSLKKKIETLNFLQIPKNEQIYYFNLTYDELK